MRVSNQRIADRLELILKSLSTKYSKMSKVTYILQEINDTLVKIKSTQFLQEVANYLQNEDDGIEMKEIKID